MGVVDVAEALANSGTCPPERHVPEMLQFRLHSLFVITLTAAVFLGIAQTAGYVVAAGIVVAIFLLRWAIWYRRRGRFIYLRIGSAVFALVAIWFLAVDWSWFVADCPDCGYGRDIAQYRVIGIPVCTRVQEWPSATQLKSHDLGVPCEHRKLETYQKQRHWGLILCAWPNIRGISRLT